MTDCERADLLIGLLEPGDTSADDALTPAERAEAQAHVRGCAACREALEAYRALSGALRALPPARDEAPTPEATARAYAAVVEAMGAANTAGGPGWRWLWATSSLTWTDGAREPAAMSHNATKPTRWRSCPACTRV